MFETSTTNLVTGYSGTTINGGTGTFLSATNNLGLSMAVTNQNNMVRQVKVAVFEVSRNEDNKVISSKLVKELWIEQKNGSSIELAVAKQLEKDFDPANTVIKEMYSYTF